jgi:outer membrane protein, heavy metal efflux system
MRKTLLFFLTCVLLASLARAGRRDDSTSAPRLVLSDILEAARLNNPELKAAQKKLKAVRARIPQEASLDDPRIEFERMYAPRDSDPFSGAEEKSVAISQEIPFPTTLYYRGRAAQREAEMAEAGYQAKEREILSRVKNAYAMLYLSRHALHIFEANVALMRQFAKVAESKYSVGKASQGDALKAQVELSRMLNMLVMLEQEKETNQAMLNTLLNRDPDFPLGLPEDPTSEALKDDLRQLTARAVAARPELREAASNVERANALVGAARSEYLPDIMLQYRRRTMMNGPDTHDAMVAFSVPIWIWKQGAMVNEAKAEREIAEAESATMTNMTRFDVKNLYVKVQTAARLVELYRSSVLPQAEQALKVAEAAYQSDKTGFLDLLDAARSLLEFRLEHYQHIAEYLTLTADLERVTGTDLKEN